MKITKIKATKSELSSSIDLSNELSGLNRADKAAALNEIGEYLVEQTLLNAAESSSPVKGELIPALTSKQYKLKKQEEAGNTKANLELSGDMLNAVDYQITSDGLKIGVFGSEALKADGHNNFSGDSKLPKRRIFPGEGQQYRSNIEKEIVRIIADHKTESSLFKVKDLKNISTKAEFYDVIGKRLGITSRSEIRLAILRSDSLLSMIEELDLDEYL